MTKDDEKKKGYFSRLFRAGMGQCPSPEEIIAYVEGEKVDPSIEHHLRHCSVCRSEMEDIRSELTHGTMRFSPQRLKDLAYEFIKRYYPSELDLFDIAWRVFHDILPGDFRQEAVSGALGLVGQETEDLKSPKVIVVFNAMSDRVEEQLSDEQKNGIIADLARQVGCPQKLTRQLREFVSGQ